MNRSQRFTFLLLTSMPTASPRPPFTSHWFSGSSDAILYCRLSSNKQSSGFDNSLLLQTSHPCHTLHLNVGRPLLSIHFFSHSAQSSAEIHHILIQYGIGKVLAFKFESRLSIPQVPLLQLLLTHGHLPYLQVLRC